MIEIVVNYLSTIPWEALLFFGFFFALIENLFPPSPSDTIIVFLGSIAALTNHSILNLVLLTTLGSIIGFYIMFILGGKFGHILDDSKRFKFINRKDLNIVENWFSKWGYWVIVINRLISGTRGIISFFAGMSKLDVLKTQFLAGISALVWNLLLLYFGYWSGSNWEMISQKIKYYGSIFSVFIVLIIIFFIIRYFYINKKKEV